MIKNRKVLLPILAVLIFFLYWLKQPETEAFPGSFPNGIETDFLTLRTTVSQAEEQNLAINHSMDSKPVPFGFMNKYWIRLKDELRSNDELWYYSEPGS